MTRYNFFVNLFKRNMWQSRCGKISSFLVYKVPVGATFGPHSPTWATDGIPTAQTFSGNMRGYSGMPMYTEALNTLGEQAPAQKEALESQFIDPTTGLTPDGRDIQHINALFNEVFGRNVNLEGVTTYLPHMQQGLGINGLRNILYNSDEAKNKGISAFNTPIDTGVYGGLLSGAPYVAPALPSGSSGILDVVPNTQPVINQPAITQPVINQTVDQIAAGQQTIGDTLTDTDMSTATPSTFELYGSQIDQLMPIYQQELGRSIQDPAALAYYGDQLKNGLMTPEQVRANISGSIEGQQYDAKQAAAAQNSANLGFGATTGGQADNFVPDMPAYLGDDVVFPDGEFMGSFENGFTNLLEGGGITGAIGNAFSDLIGGSEKDKVDTVSAATGMSTSEVGSLIQNLAGAAGAVTAATLANTPAGRLVMDLFPDTFKSTLNTSVPVDDKGSTTNDINTANTIYQNTANITPNSGRFD